MFRTRLWAAIGATVIVAASLAVGGMDRAHEAPRVRLHGGSAWLASSKTGQLTLLDGASAEVAARVEVAPPGTPIQAAQQGPTGYSLNKSDGSVVRVDGATQFPSAPAKLSASDIFPTPEVMYSFDGGRGLLTPVELDTLNPLGEPFSLASKVFPEGAIVDGSGRLWILDRATGDLTWFTPSGGQTRTAASTADRTRLTVTDGRPALLDLARRTAELLDPEDGSVQESIRADLRPDDEVALSGSAQQQRILISVASRGLLMVCSFGASCADPIPLGTGKADLGAAIEIGDHAIVPDYSSGQVWIVDLRSMSVVTSRQLFDRPLRFELLTRDGMVFYNDPDSDQAGVLDLNGDVRAVSKYKADSGPAQLALDGPSTTRQPPSTPNRPRSGPTGAVPPVSGRGDPEPAPPAAAPLVDIVIKPRDRALVGEELELTAVAPVPVGLTGARWTFGDGTETTGLTVRHAWANPGVFQVQLFAMTDMGPAQVATATVTVERAETVPRITGLTITPKDPKTGKPVRFSARVTGPRPDRWEWTITGTQGRVIDSTKREFQYTFTTPGTYTVTLAVTAGGERAERSQQLKVERATCQWRVEKIKAPDGEEATSTQVNGTDSKGNYSGTAAVGIMEKMMVVLWTDGEPRIAHEFAFAWVADENSAGTVLVNGNDPQTGRSGVFLLARGHTGNGTVTHLRAPDGYQAEKAVALNDRGDALGSGQRTNDGHGVTLLWPVGGEPIVIDTPVGAGADLDDDGTVLLHNSDNGSAHLWRSGAVIPLSGNGSFESGVIRAGKILRWEKLESLAGRSFLYSRPDAPRLIENGGTAEAMNANGLIVGRMSTQIGPPAVWRDTAFLAELPLPDGVTEIADGSFVVGDDDVIYGTATGYGPVKWTCS
ncbi:PKD domain-containing protein [Kibdelosporangium philippinense]|uniref:PKD domain-containing protein n=1 Tax=Kibdelosporangium philippinense TaxID=211113 RepID=A0ABS8Z9M2_9PSEU|nr:PKD domain-containing protein [Kibdelosporangium philippinense]MCE7003733.1 PKD domain-containing protein [Kibdelosporangium philippinense]